MRTTIDAAGRVVIPKPIRDALGLVGGTPVDIVIDGAAIRIDGPPVEAPDVEVVNGWFNVVRGGEPLTADDVREARLAGQMRHE